MKQGLGLTGSLLCCVVALALTGCGGGAGGGGPAVVPSIAVAGSSPVSVRVIDGAIQGATVCLDKNDNGSCDSGEPHGTTGATGEAVFDVANNDLGKYPMLALVPATAVDRDTGAAVGTAFVMRAPKDATNLVTPLSTVVKNYADAMGITTLAAATAVQQQIGATRSPLSDFSNGGDADLQALANALVLATQKQNQLIQSVVGSAVSGGLVSQPDVDQIAEQTVAVMLDALVEVAADPQVTQATNAASRVAAIKRLTEALVASNGLQDKASAVAAIQQFKASRLSAAGTRCLPGYIPNAGNCVPVTTKLPTPKLACSAGFFKVVGTGLDRGCIAAWTITQGTLTAAECTAIGAKYGQTFARVFTNTNGSVCVFNFL